MYRIKKTAAALASLLSVIILSAAFLYNAAPAFAESELIPEEDIKAESTNYKTVHPEIGTYSDTVSINGSAFVPHKTTVLYKGHTAKYIQTAAKHGDIVKEGDPLVEISIEVDEYHLAELELKLQRAKEDLEDRERTYALDVQDLQRNLNELPEDAAYARKAVSIRIQKAALEFEKYRLEQGRNIEKMQEELDELYIDREVQYIYAPCDGFVYNNSFFEEDSYITPNQAICTIADISSIMVRVTNDHFSRGMSAVIEAGANKNRFQLPAEVLISSNAFGDAMGSFALMKPELGDIDLSSMAAFTLNLDRIIFNVTAETVHMENVMVIPKTAAYPDDKNYYILKTGENNVIHKRYFIPGLDSKEKCWVLYGLDETDSLIIN